MSAAPMNAVALETIALALGAGDLLVIERGDGILRLTGGHGRGAGWAGIVEVPLDDEPLAAEAIALERVVRRSAFDPERIVGPYWARRAALVPVGESHLAVFGGDDLERASDGELLRHAANAVAACGTIPAEKLLADELEVVHAVRALMSRRPETVAATAHHLAAVASDALSCDIGVVLVRDGDRSTVAIHGIDGAAQEDPGLEASLMALGERARTEPVLEQEVAERVEMAGMTIVSRLAVKIGSDDQLGLLVVGHASHRPRGFTTLCQRIGRSLAEASEMLLGQAMLKEAMTAERDRYAHQARSDSLTGLANRVAWQEALTAIQSEMRTSLVAFDVDGLKTVNDTAGHAAGDALLVAAADALRSAVRDGDVVARLGGDEFGVLLRGGSETTARIVVNRVREATAEWQAGSGPHRLTLTAGWAETRPGESPLAAFARADEMLCTAKRC